jgi:hypothetical protein
LDKEEGSGGDEPPEDFNKNKEKVIEDTGKKVAKNLNTPPLVAKNPKTPVWGTGLPGHPQNLKILEDATDSIVDTVEKAFFVQREGKVEGHFNRCGNQHYYIGEELKNGVPGLH